MISIYFHVLVVLAVALAAASANPATVVANMTYETNALGEAKTGSLWSMSNAYRLIDTNLWSIADLHIPVVVPSSFIEIRYRNLNSDGGVTTLWAIFTSTCASTTITQYFANVLDQNQLGDFWSFNRPLPGTETQPIAVECRFDDDTSVATEYQFMTCYLSLTSAVVDVSHICLYLSRAIPATNVVEVQTTVFYVALRHANLTLPGTFSDCPTDSCVQTQLTRTAADCVIANPSANLSQTFLNQGLPFYSESEMDVNEPSESRIYYAPAVKAWLCKDIDYSVATYPTTKTCNITGTNCPVVQSSSSTTTPLSSSRPLSSSQYALIIIVCSSLFVITYLFIFINNTVINISINSTGSSSLSILSSSRPTPSSSSSSSHSSTGQSSTLSTQPLSNTWHFALSVVVVFCVLALLPIPFYAIVRKQRKTKPKTMTTIPERVEMYMKH